MAKLSQEACALKKKAWLCDKFFTIHNFLITKQPQGPKIKLKTLKLRIVLSKTFAQP